METGSFQLERVGGVQVTFDPGMPLIRNAILNHSIFSFNNVDGVRSWCNDDIPQTFPFFVYLCELFDNFTFHFVPEAQLPHHANDPRSSHTDRNEVDLSIMLH